MISKTNKAISRLKKAKGLIAKAIIMVEQGALSVDIVQQIAKAIRLLESAQRLYVENYLEECSRKALRLKSPKKRTELFQEILKMTKMYNK